jgi:hypothetical protein
MLLVALLNQWAIFLLIQAALLMSLYERKYLVAGTQLAALL